MKKASRMTYVRSRGVHSRNWEDPRRADDPNTESIRFLVRNMLQEGYSPKMIIDVFDRRDALIAAHHLLEIHFE